MIVYGICLRCWYDDVEFAVFLILMSLDVGFGVIITLLRARFCF